MSNLTVFHAPGKPHEGQHQQNTMNPVQEKEK